jgi:hypothetical protein
VQVPKGRNASSSAAGTNGSGVIPIPFASFDQPLELTCAVQSSFRTETAVDLTARFDSERLLLAEKIKAKTAMMMEAAGCTDCHRKGR